MPYSNIKLISFDLDNTLYDNRPILQLAEKKSQEYLNQAFLSQEKRFSFDEFASVRNRLIASQNELPDNQKGIYENLSYLRLQVLKVVCQELDDASEIVQNAFNIFMKYRSKVNIDPSITSMLKKLAKDYLLVSVTNGNCDVRSLSIDSFFQKSYSPLASHRAKPNPQMLLSVMQDFRIQPENVLHVGDKLSTDGEAAEKANCPFYFLSPFEGRQIDKIQIQKFIHKLTSKN